MTEGKKASGASKSRAPPRHRLAQGLDPPLMSHRIERGNGIQIIVTIDPAPSDFDTLIKLLSYLVNTLHYAPSAVQIQGSRVDKPPYFGLYSQEIPLIT